jgi:hypothetical protein
MPPSLSSDAAISLPLFAFFRFAVRHFDYWFLTLIAIDAFFRHISFDDTPPPLIAITPPLLFHFHWLRFRFLFIDISRFS